jgi:hypothetical protein
MALVESPTPFTMIRNHLLRTLEIQLNSNPLVASGDCRCTLSSATGSYEGSSERNPVSIAKPDRDAQSTFTTSFGPARGISASARDSVRRQ